MKNSFSKLSRRDFLRAGAATPLLAAGCASLQPPNTPASGPLVGTQLYGWGQYYERAGKKLTDHHDEVLSAVRDCGFAYAETSLDLAHPENSVKFAQLAKGKGVGVECFYCGPALHDSKQAEANVTAVLAAAKAVRAFGTRVINCNPAPIGREKTNEELRTQADALFRLGAGLRALGMWLGVHNHTPEMKSKAREFHHNFTHTPADKVGFCFDVHWVWRGGVMPLDAFDLYGDRLVSWHLRQSLGGVWWEELDAGPTADIDYQFFAMQVKQQKHPPLYTVELALEKDSKITRDVVENHRRSREWVRKVFGV